MRAVSTLALSLAFGASMWFPDTAIAAPKVATSIKPVHSLVAAVMEGVGEPELLIEGNLSPHNFVMKPSQAKSLQNADLIVWIGHALEPALEKPVAEIGARAVSLELLEVDGVELFEPRIFEDGLGHGEETHEVNADHDKHEHKEDGHTEHGQDEHAHDEDKHAEHEHDHDEHGEGHDHGLYDPHIWLDPENAKAMVLSISDALSKLDPDNAETYARNANSSVSELTSLTIELEQVLEPVKGGKFVGFHDSYQYFEYRFEVAALDIVAVNPETPPGAEHIRELREKLSQTQKVCLLREPQFSSKIIGTVAEGLETTVTEVDPLGAEIEAGPDLYFQLLRNMANEIRACLDTAG